MFSQLKYFALYQDRCLADCRRGDGWYGGHVDALESHRLRNQPNVRGAVVLALGDWGIRLWHDVHGHGPSLSIDDQYGQMVVWRINRGDDRIDPGC